MHSKRGRSVKPCANSFRKQYFLFLRDGARAPKSANGGSKYLAHGVLSSFITNGQDRIQVDQIELDRIELDQIELDQIELNQIEIDQSDFWTYRP